MDWTTQHKKSQYNKIRAGTQKFKGNVSNELHSPINYSTNTKKIGRQLRSFDMVYQAHHN
jgi:hypothetical protein